MTFERCNDCGLLHEECSATLMGSEDSRSSSLEQVLFKQDPPRCPRCQLLHSFLCISLDNSSEEVSHSSSHDSFLDEDTIGWSTFQVEAHRTSKLNWLCSWIDSHTQLHETLHKYALRPQPATLVSCALQVLDDAGHLDFNIQDPCSLEIALTLIGAMDQLPVQEASMEENNSNKKVAFCLPGDDAGGGGRDISYSNSFLKKDKTFLLKQVLEDAMRSLTPVQTLAVDVLFDSDPSNWIGNPLISNFETAISNMNPLQSLAVAVKAGYVDSKSLPQVVDSDFIRKNMNMKLA